MNLEERKKEILSTIKKEFLKLNISIKDEEIISNVAGKSWFLWIEQKDGLNTSADRLEVNLSDLDDGVYYSIAIAYRVNRWMNFGNRGPGKNVLK